MYTDNYIKMCEQAEEIQKAWKKKRYDYAYCEETKLVKLCCDISFWETRIDLIWLPILEQLIEMINAYSNYERVNRFYDFVHLDADEYGYNEWCEFVNNSSMNELWLAFVMHEKYHKIWTGEKWKEVVKKMPKQQTLKL